jgi:hypothetical protein
VLDLPYWVAPALYEIELDGDVAELSLKVAAPRGRLVRRVDAWDDEARDAYCHMCIDRAGELAASAGRGLAGWAPPHDAAAAGPALMGFMAARIAEQTGGLDVYVDERVRQSRWLADRLSLE